MVCCSIYSMKNTHASRNHAYNNYNIICMYMPSCCLLFIHKKVSTNQPCSVHMGCPCMLMQQTIVWAHTFNT